MSDRISELPVASEAIAGNDLVAVTNVSQPGTGETQQFTVSQLLSLPWTNYTPTLTNLAGGTINISRYLQIGKIVLVKFQYTCGGADVSGDISISLPVTGANTLLYDPIGRVVFRDADTAPYNGIIIATSTTLMRPRALKADATYLSFVAISSIIPMTWAINDNIMIEAMYEAA